VKTPAPTLVLLAMLALCAPAQSQSQSGAARAAASAPAAARTMPLADGQVLEIDREARTVLMKHGPIASLGMDAMTMEFVVRDDRLLSTLQPGDRLRFATVYEGGDYLLTHVEHVRRKRVQKTK
jgi:Cu(I)/Ag(I) efflux system periplasmic protein CusF